MKIRWLLWLGLGLLLVACQPYEFNGTEYLNEILAPDFTLADSEGRPFQLSTQQGQVVLMFFGYTSCPDVCPVTLTEAKQIIQQLGDNAEQVKFLFITVDPERDTPEVLGKYVANFHPAIIGLSGTHDELENIRSDYGIHAEKIPLDNSEAGYSMEHTARVFLIDRAGRLRLSYVYGTPADDIVQDVRYLLRQ